MASEPTKAESLKRIVDAFAALEAAETSMSSAQCGLEGIDPVILKTFPVGRRTRVKGTRFAILHDGQRVTVYRENPELSTDDLAVQP